MLEPQLSWLKLACLSLSYSAKIWQIPKSSSSFRFPALGLNFPDFNFPTFEIFNFLNLQLSKFFSLSAFQIFQLSMFDYLICSNFPNLPTFNVWLFDFFQLSKVWLFDWLFDFQIFQIFRFSWFDFDCLIWLSSFLIAGVFRYHP